MVLHPDNYPCLEIIAPTQYDDQIKYLYGVIKNCRICWMAFEQLNEMPLNRKKGLTLNIQYNTIQVKSKTNRLLARVRFGELPVALPKKMHKQTV